MEEIERIAKEIEFNSKVMAKTIIENNDIMIRKNKDGDVKIMFYKPRSIRKEEE